jgi:hypothetical protein
MATQAPSRVPLLKGKDGFFKSGRPSFAGAGFGMRLHWLLIVGLIGLAALLRLYHLDASPLRGDEAFSVRYWAAPFDQVLALSRIEPHPFGALLGFGLWKALVGDSAFTMRLLPALLNLIGVPVMYALARCLFHDRRVGYVAALLWALNPMQLFHAQDVRNYAPWAALSALAVWLLLSACDRQRRIDWLLYGLAATLALYTYFAEISFLLVGALYVMIWRRAVWRSYFITLACLGLALIPWLWQGWQLAHSGYSGTAASVSLPELWTHFLPALIVGDTAPVLDSLWSTLALLLLFCAWLLIRRGYGKTVLFLILYCGIPALLLSLVSLKMAVFRVDYLLAVTPTLLLPLAYGTFSFHRWLAFRSSLVAWIMTGCLALIFIGLPLAVFSQYQKAPDWFGLRDYLVTHVQPTDLVILSTDDPVTGASDPAFDYYYQDRTPVLTLPRRDLNMDDTIRAAAAKYRAIWFMPSGQTGGLIDQSLRANMQLISDEGAGRGLIIREYRAPTLKPAEIEHPQVIQVGSISLRGFSLEQSRTALTLILYWQPGGLTTDTAFIHITGATNPATGTPLWTQDDHPPQFSVIAPRDVYHMTLTNLPPGTYQVMFGLYDSNSGNRHPLTDGQGVALGDNVTLISIVIP